MTGELPPRPRDARPVALTIGSYDGVHRGHVALLDELRRQADRFRGETAVITFDPHPRCVVDPHGCPPALSTIDERRTLLHTHGADHVTVLRFTRELSEWSAEQFCDALVDSFRLRALVVGPGFALGHKRAGDVRFLRTYGAQTGFSVVEVPPRTWRGERISSGRVREALLRGHLGMANAMLGRMYTVGGRVVTGDRIGKRLGFPTANLAPDEGRLVPAEGVYATWLHAGEEWLPAATSIGVRPTIASGGALTVEAHVLDFDGDLYGKQVRLAFARRLRAQRRFASEQALRDAIASDVQRVPELLRHAAKPA